ncbi:MAG: VCBS repeat-containing protein, partial [Saprospiraceae bacterium]
MTHRSISLYLLATVLIACQPKKTTRFELLTPKNTGVDFVNTITENDTLNILVSEFVYNGAGVAVGDLNGDGREDLFFAGNQVDNRMYINTGDFTFEDVTQAAGLNKPDPRQWSSGVNIVDINRDGLLDIYVCNTLHKDSSLLRNLLYINQGNNNDDIPSFKEMGEAYGIADPSHSSHAQFFDYDNDGDLDLFIGVNVIEGRYPNEFGPIVSDGTNPNRDNLFRNDWDETLGHPVFTDVSLAAGLLQDGYSHSTLIYDFNEDGWQDIYVANDYQSDDLVFINNQDGTFTDQARKMFKHFSLSAMGSDVADINNDGAADLFVTEMQPYYNKRKKLFQGGSNYQNTILTERYGYTYQYPRNTLQLNRGTNPETGLPIFSDIGMFAHVQETDWSWATLFADFDNDGWKDIYIANGFPKDVTDRDFSDFRASAGTVASNDMLLSHIPEVKSPNFLFHNTGNLDFENVTEEWGLKIPSFSNGAAYADLDNDGDLDLITNNIDDPAFIFENRSNSGRHYLRVKLNGSQKNPDAFGAIVSLKFDDQIQQLHLLSGRGYLSKSESTLHFGLDDRTEIPELEVIWPDGKRSTLTNVAADQVLVVDYNETSAAPGQDNLQSPKPIFASATVQHDLQYKEQAYDYIDFNFQRTIPHKFSQYGSSISVGDVNGDGLEDVFLPSTGGFPQHWFIQQEGGHFTEKTVTYKEDEKLLEEETGSLLFDADGDGDLDLYLVRGSAQFKAGSELYKDVLYLNDGKGEFTLTTGALPEITANGSCVKAADFDLDGDLDLFVGSRVLPSAYPLPDRSFLLRNDSESGQVKFTDVTEHYSPALIEPGLISDALWTDFNNDHRPDLILAGEWMPIRFFQNDGEGFTEITDQSGLAGQTGWWNSLAAADLDLDGDIDYIAGNFGENIYYQCTSDEPIRIYGKDLDKNGTIDPLISCYWQDSLGERHEYLYHPRADLVKQFVGIRKKFNTHGAYGEATVPEMFTKEEMADALILNARWMKSSVIENLGNGQFAIRALPIEAQLAPLYGILPKDVNNDGQPDLLLVGNDFGMEVQQGRADAFAGLVLINQGNWDFKPLSIAESHFTIMGEGRGLVSLLSDQQQELILGTQHRDSLRVFTYTEHPDNGYIPLTSGEVKAVYHLKNGQTRVEEWYWGSSFMSQRGRYLTI